MVETKTFDFLFKDKLTQWKRSNKEVLVKIDVENCEHLVLDGMKVSLLQLRPFLVVELLEGNPFTRQICISTGRALEAFDPLQSSHFNYLFSPTERVDTLSMLWSR